MSEPSFIRLDQFDNRSFDRGRSWFVELLWLLVGAPVIRSGLPGSRLRIIILRVFGACIGSGVVIKPHVKVKFPWRLTIGANSWIGEGVWIDNLAEVKIGSNACLSQGAYLCTGSHNWSAPTFDLIARPIEIGDEAWICANASVGPGVRAGRGAVLTLGAVATHDLEEWTCYAPDAPRATRRRRGPAVPAATRCFAAPSERE
jgi:putative colanic acid biosynthesis acetyltransferase WcaF